MKDFLRKIYENKFGKYVIYILFYAVIIPINLCGKILFYSSKPIRAFGFLLMGAFSSAKEEITEWDIMLNLGDVL